MLRISSIPIEWYIAVRYFRPKKRQGFLSLITVISIIGVAVGVMALIVVLAVMNGFQTDLRTRILGITAHIMIQDVRGTISDYKSIAKTIEKINGVAGVSPYIYIQALFSTGRTATGAVIQGVEVESAKKVMSLDQHLVLGSADDLLKNEPGIILGTELARQLGVDLYDNVSVLVPKGRLTPLGQLPQSRIFKVVGLFQSGMYQYDQSLAYINLSQAQQLSGISNTVMGLEVRLNNPEMAHDVSEKLRKLLGDYYIVRDWMQLNRNLFSALKLEKTVMFTILTLIVLVAAFNIVSSLIMLVMNKTRDIAILKAMGATVHSVRRAFMITGFLIGLSGTLAGIIGGLTLCGILKKYHFIELPKDIYYISTLPVKVEYLDVCIVCMAALFISFIATVYPSSRAAKMDPVEVLRYE